MKWPPKPPDGNSEGERGKSAQPPRRTGAKPTFADMIAREASAGAFRVGDLVDAMEATDTRPPETTEDVSPPETKPRYTDNVIAFPKKPRAPASGKGRRR